MSPKGPSRSRLGTVSAAAPRKSSPDPMRVGFLIDGFNLYHSLDEASAVLAPRGAKWLDLRAFCTSFLPLLGARATLGPIHYFSALAKHIEAWKPDVTLRHAAYIRCLEESGVVVELGQFKEKWITCPHCSREITRHEEKETDVAIGVRLVELFCKDRCNAAVLVTADSDLSPAIRTANVMFPKNPIYAVIPYGRGSFDLEALATGHFKAKKERYAKHQFPDPFDCADGTKIAKPPSW